MAEKRTTYKIQDIEGIGEVQIADEVVTIIAGLAATEVDGVASMAGNITNELVSKLGMKNLSKGVKVEIVDSVVSVDLTLNIEYGMNILETSKKVQEKVKAVSYTHLDVYKRQVRGLVAPAMDAIKRTALGRTAGAIPVSYTHLDVYKRQGLPHWKHIFGFFPL